MSQQASHSYEVFPLAVDGPFVGQRQTISERTVESHLGWHEVNGTHYTSLKGNNVHVYGALSFIDSSGKTKAHVNDRLGFSDGNFNYPLLNYGTADPATYIEATMTQAFYVCNMVHDIL